MQHNFFFPVRNGAGTKIDTLQAGENLGKIDDVQYFSSRSLKLKQIII